MTGVSLHATLRQFQKTAEFGPTREQHLHRVNKVKGPEEMGVEIERKFRIRSEEWRGEKVRSQYRIDQGYLSVEKERTVRVRLKGESAYLTVKGVARGLTRLEFEYEIPVEDAEVMLGELCGERRLTKTRFEVEYEGHLWEIDVFEGANQGLVVAEVELREEGERPVLPPWVGEEVSGDPRYYNARLVEKPFREWEGEALSKE